MILKEVVSYASREPREDEVEGREHYFISVADAEKMIEEQNIKIKTTINGVIYFSTDEEIRSKNTYKIDPIGLKRFKEEYSDLDIKTIYIHCPRMVRMARTLDSRGTSYEFEKREEAENHQFDLFEASAKYDYKIENINLKESVAELMLFIDNNPADMYCIVGRTGSGKDTIIKETNKILEKLNRNK